MTAQPCLDGRIAIGPDIRNGKPPQRGKRIAVQTMLEFLRAGDTEAEILQQSPRLDTANSRACLGCATRLMKRRHGVAQGV